MIIIPEKDMMSLEDTTEIRSILNRTDLIFVL